MPETTQAVETCYEQLRVFLGQHYFIRSNCSETPIPSDDQLFASIDNLNKDLARLEKKIHELKPSKEPQCNPIIGELLNKTISRHLGQMIKALDDKPNYRKCFPEYKGEATKLAFAFKNCSSNLGNSLMEPVQAGAKLPEPEMRVAKASEPGKEHQAQHSDGLEQKSSSGRQSMQIPESDDKPPQSTPHPGYGATHQQYSWSNGCPTYPCYPQHAILPQCDVRPAQQYAPRGTATYSNLSAGFAPSEYRYSPRAPHSNPSAGFAQPEYYYSPRATYSNASAGFAQPGYRYSPRAPHSNLSADFAQREHHYSASFSQRQQQGFDRCSTTTPLSPQGQHTFHQSTWSNYGYAPPSNDNRCDNSQMLGPRVIELSDDEYEKPESTPKPRLSTADPAPKPLLLTAGPAPEKMVAGRASGNRKSRRGAQSRR